MNKRIKDRLEILLAPILVVLVFLPLIGLEFTPAEKFISLVSYTSLLVLFKLFERENG